MGPACGLTSCVRLVEEDADPTAFVEAITELVGKVRKRVNVERKWAWFWQLAPGKGQRRDACIKVKGWWRRIKKGSEGNRRLVTIITYSARSKG